MYDNVRKPESDWYEAGYTAPRTDTAGTGCYDSYWSPSQAAAPKKKPHQGLKITMIILGVLVLIIASCYVFAGRGRDSISVDGDPGQHGSVTLPREDTDDDTTVTGKNELPTAPTDPGVTMTLQPAGGSALTLQSVYAKCLPSVVGIHADISRSEYSTGTGIVLTADGYIVTNTHVLDGAKAVTVTTSDGTEYTGKLVGADAVSDIAVLKIEAQGLTPAEFGDSSSLQVGDDVVSIGNPLGEQLLWTMTNGIISAINR
ncbi:MAG: trypsin-like peptidase domain-containing protein, partial [Oscillospiraceae bacterium]|nr:trypsin-like peptidase domain-containing protein [Oscillospiraceae bacterium]